MAVQAQIGVQVVIQNGSASSECTDLLSGPDPLFAVSAQGAAYQYYPRQSGCYNTLPDTVFQANYTCPALVPTTVEICLRVSENDALLQPPFGCDIFESCSETICQDFIIPPFGTTANYNLSINVPGSSSGSIDFTIQTGGFAFPDNDFICNAVDLGTLTYGDTIGDATQGIYSNLCATNLNEGNPIDVGYYFTNEAGVWFRFNSGPNPSGLLVVETVSDPNNTGEDIILELGIYTSNNGTCNGTLIPIPSFNLLRNGNDIAFRVPCIIPNTDYFIQIDGSNNNGDHRGIFGLQIWDLGVAEGGDLRCEAWNLGVVPTGGEVTTPEPAANFCATELQDPFVPIFTSQHSVWFSFIPPPSGHVIIEAISDTLKAPIDIQLGLYRSFNNTCTGFFSHVASQYTPEDLDEVLEVSCLFSDRPYFILIDGGGAGFRGAFNITVRDAGDITPVNEQTLVLCSDETVRVGPNTYNTTGIYSDTLQVFQGCDSIVITNLTVLEELQLSVNQTQFAIGEDGQNGRGTASATGGTGNYTYSWCNGESGPNATMLRAGELCCVTVTDDNGCSDEFCFTVEFTTAIIPTFANDTLACYGDNDGVVAFTLNNGVPPYRYQWQNATATLSGSGQIDTQGGGTTIPNLPAGAYTVSVNDDYLDTVFTVLVVQPEELRIELTGITNASCFGYCDGTVATSVTGGTLPYSFNWTNNPSTTDAATDLCASAYRLQVTDANGCRATLEVNVEQPAEFIATATQAQAVSCFQGSDGIAQVTDNGNSVAWNWSNGAAQQVAGQLAAGTYIVTVTNGDGCRDTTTVAITEPNAPLLVSVSIRSAISCAGDSDGQLETQVTGPFASLSYSWDNGANAAIATGLSADTYTVSVTNEKGCLATATYLFNEPTPVFGTTFATDINCLDGPNAGAISIEDVSGGTPGYRYALDNGTFGDVPLYDALTAGNYAVTIRDAAGCLLVLPTTILPPPEITVNLSGEDMIALGDEITLRAQPSSDNVRFTWSHTDTLTTGNARVRPTETTLYQVTVLDTLTFCEATDLLRVFVDKRARVYVPNVFSPNGDGSNDTFLPLGGNDVVGIQSLQIFSRTGQLVFEAQNIAPGATDQGWDGTFNGRTLNPGVFVYSTRVEFYDGRVEVIKGDVVLMQ